MTDTRCSRCDEWFDPGYDSHDTSHTDERTVDALERIAAALEVLTGKGTAQPHPGEGMK